MLKPVYTGIIYRGVVPQEHGNFSLLAIGRGVHIGVVESTRVVHGHNNFVICLTDGTIGVALLEVVRSEAVSVGNIVDRVGKVEGVCSGGVEVVGRLSGVGVQVVVVDVTASGLLHGGEAIGVNVRVDVVTTIRRYV